MLPQVFLPPPTVSVQLTIKAKSHAKLEMSPQVELSGASKRN